MTKENKFYLFVHKKNKFSRAKLDYQNLSLDIVSSSFFDILIDKTPEMSWLDCEGLRIELST